jgi:D-alanyl-D-alanine dipeptidase
MASKYGRCTGHAGMGLCVAEACAGTALPEGFVYLDEVAPGIRVELAYAGRNNFVGKSIDGYAPGAVRAILTRQAASALAQVQKDLQARGLGLKVFDSYRPKRAVRHFYRWAQDARDLRHKARYYPQHSKRELFSEGYIARRSSHSRGSTLDLTLIDLSTGGALDMGSPFDFFGRISWYSSKQVSPRQKANRKLLREQMMKRGFRPFVMEWWHFTLHKEPFPRSYFDFEVR